MVESGDKLAQGMGPFEEAGYLITLFVKGKPVERPGRKATGLRARLTPD